MPLKTAEACPYNVGGLGKKGSVVISVPASSSCEVGIRVAVQPGEGEETVGAFTIPLLVGPEQDAAPLTLTGTG